MKMLIMFLFPFLLTLSANPGDQIIGEYWTEGQEGKIAIYKCANKYCGKIIWRKEVRKDVENPDPQLRNRSVIGIEFMKDFSYQASKRQWSGGQVYSIDNGGSYKGKMWLENEGQTLKMRGYIGISLLGRTASLQRVN